MNIDVSTRDSRKEFYNSPEWKKIRIEVLERDHYECQWCAAEGRVTSNKGYNRKTLEVDHIKELEYYPELALEIDNLRTLCKHHHNQRHKRFEFKRDKQKPNRTFRDDEWWG